jgi:hypothetical protein
MGRWSVLDTVFRTPTFMGIVESSERPGTPAISATDSSTNVVLFSKAHECASMPSIKRLQLSPPRVMYHLTFKKTSGILFSSAALLLLWFVDDSWLPLHSCPFPT